jgi:flagellar hook-associated protein 2
MASISSLGIGSGLDLSGLVTNLINAERSPVDSRLNRQESTLTTDLSGVGLMRGALSGFQGSLSSLSNAENFTNRNITNSNTDAITASVSNDASLGSYSIEVANLASAQSLASTAYTSLDSEIGTGTLQIKFGTITGPGFTSFTADANSAIETITVDASNNTLTGLKDYINENDFGVTASIINDGTGYRLTLLSDSTGANSAMELTVTDTGDGIDTDTNGLSNLAYNATVQNVIETQTAVDANLTINGLPVISSTNTLDEAIEGVTLNLNAATEVGSPSNLVIAEESGQISLAIKDLVNGFNSMITTLNDLSSSNPESGEVGILAGNAALRSFTFQLRNVLTSPVDGLTGDIRALIDLGISTQADGTLNIDSSKFDAAVKENPLDALALFAPVGQSSDSLINFSGSTDDTVVGEYQVNITQLATRAEFTGNSVLGFPLTIDADNDELAITVDGISTGTISFTQGDYATGDALAAEIQLQINSSILLQDAGKTVAVTFDSTNNRLVLNSTTYGSESNIVISSVDTNTALQLGLTAASGVQGLDVVGTIGGIAGTGEGSTLSIDTGDPAGISIDVQGNTVGDRGSIKFVRGFVDSLDNLLESYLDTDGVLTAKETNISESLETVREERETLELRMEALEVRLIREFTALDQLIAQFQTTGDYLAQSLANLPGSGQLLNNN